MQSHLSKNISRHNALQGIGALGALGALTSTGQTAANAPSKINLNLLLFNRLTLLLAFIFTLSGLNAEDFYTPERDQYKVDQPKAEATNDLPKVLLIGDSIMSGYFKSTKQRLTEEFQVFRHPGNAGETRNGLKKLDAWLGDTEWDIIHFNWGLHDLCYRHPEATVYGQRDKVRGTISVPIEEYAANLEQLVQRLQRTGARLIFATTTRIPAGEAGRYVDDAVKYNQAALAIMRKYDIAVNDLYQISSEFSPEMYIAPGDVHHTDAGNAALAGQVAEAIRKHGLK